MKHINSKIYSDLNFWNLVLTDDVEEGVEDARRVRGDLALVVSLVAARGVADLEAPVVGRLEHEREARVADVRVQAERDQPQLVAVPTNPRNLKHNQKHDG